VKQNIIFFICSSAKERDEWVIDVRAAVKDKVNKQQSFQQAKLIADGLNRPMTTLGHTVRLFKIMLMHCKF
jgi:hypothetical protein